MPRKYGNEIDIFQQRKHWEMIKDRNIRKQKEMK